MSSRCEKSSRYDKSFSISYAFFEFSSWIDEKQNTSVKTNGAVKARLEEWIPYSAVKAATSGPSAVKYLLPERNVFPKLYVYIEVRPLVSLVITANTTSHSIWSIRWLRMAAESECNGWAARDPSGILSPYSFNRRAVQPDDVSLRITHCGVCYADVIWSRNEHNDSLYPLVPGHEIAGVVTVVGSDVKGIKVGDHVGVGTYVNSCRDCENCNSFLENHCSKFLLTFNGVDTDGTVTKGGYSSHIVVPERYCFKIPDGYPLEKAAPLVCAGITVYTPMKRHNMNQPGKSLGVIGLGGLGHMAVKFGKAFGLKVTVFSTSESKRDEAINLLRADNFVISSDEKMMESLKSSLNFIVDTASGDHQFDPYLQLLKVGGVMALLSFPGEIRVNPAILNLGGRSLSGSVVGGTKDIEEMINFCAVNKIYPEIELIKMDYINEALERLVKRDVKYRFVIDIESSFK